MTYRDHFTELFELKERAEEDIFFARHDQELIERLRRTKEEKRRRAFRPRCPECGQHLQLQSIHGTNVKACPAGHGAWVSGGMLTMLPQKKRERWAREFLSNLMHLVEHPYG